MYKSRFLIIALATITLFCASVLPVYAAGLTVPASSLFKLNTSTLSNSGDISISATGTLLATTGAISLDGSWTNSGTFTCGTGTVTFTATATGKTLNGTMTGSTGQFYNLTFNGSGGGWTLQAAIAATNDFTLSAGTFDTKSGSNYAVTVTNDLSITGGTFTARNSTITVSRHWTMNTGGVFTRGGSTVLLNGTGNIAGTALTQFENLTVAYNTKTTTMTRSRTDVFGILTIGDASGGTMTCSVTCEFELFRTAGADLVLGTGATLSGSNATFQLRKLSAATVTVTGATNYGTWNILMHSDVAGLVTFNTGGNITTSGYMQVKADTTGTATFNTQNYTISADKWVQGDSTDNGATTSNWGSSTATFNRASATDTFYVNSNGGAQVANFQTASISVTGHTKFVNGTGTLTVDDGSSTFTFAPTTGTSTYSPNGQTLYNVIVNGAATVQPDAAVAIANDLTMTAGTINGTQNITVNGNVAGTAGIISLTGGTFEQRVAADKNFGTTSGSTAWTFSSLTYSNSSGAPCPATTTITTQTSGSGGITVSSVLLVGKSGDACAIILNAGNRTWTLSGTGGDPFQLLASPAGVLTAGTSTFYYYGRNAIGNTTVQSATYYNATIGCFGLCALGSETYVLEAATVTSNNLSISLDATLDVVSGSNWGLTIGNNYSNSGTFTAQNGTVTFNAIDASNTLSGTLSGTSAFYNLTFDGVTGDWTPGAAVTVMNDLTMTAGSLLGTQNIAVGNSGADPDVTGNGTITLTGGTFTLGGPGTVLFGGNTAWTFNNLTFEEDYSAGTIISANGTGGINVSGVLDIQGTNDTMDFSAGSKTYTLSGNSGDPFLFSGGVVTFNADTSTFTYTGDSGGNNTVQTTTYYNLTFTPGTDGTYVLEGATVVSNHLTIDGGTLDVTGSNYALTVGGNWSNSGGFTAQNGTVTFNTVGTTTVVTGTTTFYNLTCIIPAKTINFEAETTSGGNDRTNITNVLTLTGSAISGNIILGCSGCTGSDQWAIKPTGIKGGTPGWTVQYVTVSNSINLDDDYINPDNSTNGGNTTNWFSSTLVTLTSFYGLGFFGKVEIYWKTASEWNNAGFNLYVSENINGPYTKLNPTLIPGQGGPTWGWQYYYTDTNVIADGRTYYYKLEDIEFSGLKTMHGPVEAHPGLDSDGDGMTDDWEIYYGLNPNDPSDASLDLDGDGLTNLEEFLEGTDPNQRDNPLQEGFHIISQDETGIVAELITNNFEAIPKKLGREIYQVLRIPGYEHGYTNQPGKPQMPLKVVTLEIPRNVKCEISNLDFKMVEYPGYNIYPVPDARLDRDLKKIMQEKSAQKLAKERPSNRNEKPKPSQAKRPEVAKIKLYPQIDAEFYSEDEYYPADTVSLGYVGRSKDRGLASVNIYPLTFNPPKHSLRFYSRIRFKLVFHPGDGNGPPVTTPPPGLRQVKIYTVKEGIYRIGWDELWNAGFFDIGRSDPRKLRLYNLGQEIAMRVIGEEDGIFNHEDYIEFYGQENNSKYSKYNVYWLFFRQGNGKRMQGVPSSSEQAQSYPDRFKWKEYSEINDFYWPERIGDEYADRWFQESYIWGGTQVNYPINLKGVNLLHPEDTARIKLAYYGIFNVQHHTLAYLNNQPVDDVLWRGLEEHTLDKETPQSNLREGNNTITIEAVLYPGVQYDLYVPNYFAVEYWRNFMADQDKLEFSHQSANGDITQFDISGFTNADLKLFDITHPLEPDYITGFQVNFQNGAYTLTFKYDFQPQEERRFVALAADRANIADSLKMDIPSNLAWVGNRIDYLMIYYGPFKNKLYSLRDLYINKGLKVKLVDLEDIYDEFNYGLSSPHAVKDFLRYAYQQWQPPAPSYVLLVGDAHYDYRDNLGSGVVNFCPVYLLPNTLYLGETASDNWFVCLDGNEDILADMSIGRFPVRTEAELEAVVNKTIDYATQGYQDWNKQLTLAADDEQVFENVSESFLPYIPGYMTTTKLYLAYYGNYPQFTQDLINNINAGRLILNYVGHGSTNLWTGEELFNTNTIGLLSNPSRYPFVTSYDCLDGYFLHLTEEWQALAEVFVRRQGAGAIACFSPSGMGLPENHQYLGSALFESIFTYGIIRLGPAVTEAKLKFFSITGREYSKGLIDTYTLFGDPALDLKIQ